MHKVWTIIILAGVLSACANVSRFERAGLVAYGEPLNDAGEPLYYSILLKGNALETCASKVKLRLAPEAAPVSVSELSPVLVAKYLQPFIPPPQWPERWKKKAMEEDSYAGGGFHVRFVDKRILSIGICSHCSGMLEHPVIGTSDGERYYSLPLTERQMIEVFGAPERIYKVNEVRY